nr:MAG TPA: hypothetical protein [Bacteriophage sp.]
MQIYRMKILIIKPSREYRTSAITNTQLFLEE